jgi:hypothetical protein
MHLRPWGERARLARGQAQRGVEAVGRVGERRCLHPEAALDVFARHADQGERATLAGAADFRRSILRVQRARARAQAGRLDGDLIAHAHAAGVHGAGGHGADAAQREHAVDGEAELPAVRPHGAPAGSGAQMRIEHGEALAAARGHGKHRPVRLRRAGEDGGQLRAHCGHTLGGHGVDLGQRHHAVAQAEQAQDVQVLFGLRHHAVVGRHDQ